jgi:hypothetical protein
LPSDQVNTDAPAPKYSQKHHISSEKLQPPPHAENTKYYDEPEKSNRGQHPPVQAIQSASDLSAVPPRAHSAGPASAGSRRSDSQPRVGGALNTLRAGAGNLTPHNKSAAAAVQPPRSISANPLHKTRTHSFGRSGDGDDKGPARGPVPGPQCGAGLHLRRSLPAKTQGIGYAPLARAQSSGLGATGSLGHLPQPAEPVGNAQAGSQARLAGASGFRSPYAAGSYAGTMPRSGADESSPKSGRSHQAPQPGSVSPLLMPCHSAGNTSVDHTPHHQAARANSQTRVASSGLSGRYAGQYQPPHLRSATPPAPHHGGARLGLAKAAQPPARGISPGVGDSHYASGGLSKATSSASGSLGPARALSAPRVQPGSTHQTPPGPPSVRTQAAQSGYHASLPVGATAGGHVPSSPSLTSPYMASTPTAMAPQHFGPQSPTVFPASPSVRGSSPAPGYGYSGGYAGVMHTGRGQYGQASGMHRNASPMGGATYSGGVPIGGISSAGGFDHRSCVVLDLPAAQTAAQRMVPELLTLHV